MRKIMEKVMTVKKDGGQEVLITLGIAAVGVTLLVIFWQGGQDIVNDLIGTETTGARGMLKDLFKPE